MGTAMGFGIHNNGWWARGSELRTVTITTPPSAEPAPKTISSAPTIGTFRGITLLLLPYAGMYQVLRPDGCYQAVHRQAATGGISPTPSVCRDLRVSMQLFRLAGEGRLSPIHGCLLHGILASGDSRAAARAAADADALNHINVRQFGRSVPITVIGLGTVAMGSCKPCWKCPMWKYPRCATNIPIGWKSRQSRGGERASVLLRPKVR